jgi:MFS family permease
MRWLILSGALHNFNMYAIASFITPFLMRYHGVDIRKANFISMVVYGLTGSIGLIFGGIAGDACSKRKTNGRLTVGTLAILCSVPFLFLALAQPRGDTTGFMLLMGTACAAMYVYYSSVYATIHDVIEPSLRGTAMAVYFFAMYLLGASLGPYGTGLLSDLFTTRAARAAGVLGVSQQVLEPFRADGLHAAMYVVPVLSVLLTAVLFAASRTVVRDVEGLQSWMRSAAKAEQGAD